MQIQIEHNPSKTRLEELGILACPIWEKEVSTFDWFYDSEEVCFLLKGEVTVRYGDTQAVNFGAGDLVIFPKGLACQWQVTQAVKKHYVFR